MKHNLFNRLSKKKYLYPLLVIAFLLIPIVTVAITRDQTNLFSQAATIYTAGLTTKGNRLDSGNLNGLSATQVKTGTNGGVLSSVSVYIGKVQSAPKNHMQVAVYADNGTNTPGTLLTTTASQTLTANKWNTFAMPSIVINPNTSYWLTFNVDGDKTQYAISDNGQPRSTWKFPVTYKTWPNPFGVPTQPVDNRQYSIYMTYTGTSNPLPTSLPTATPMPTADPTATPTVATSATPMPTAIPTIPSGGQTNCESVPSRCGYPDTTNTGITPETSLTVVNGDMTISTPNQVVEGKDIRGCVVVEAAGVIIRNSKITCNGYYGILTNGDAAKQGSARLLVQNVELSLGGNTTGIAFDNINARQVYIHGGENGFSLDKDSTVENSFITGIVEVNGGHGDGIQIGAPAANILINHNTIFGYGVTSAVNWTDDTVSMTVQNNLLAGGQYSLYCPRVPVTNGAFKTINNRFGTYTVGPTQSCGGVGQVFTGNYSDSNLSTLQAE